MADRCTCGRFITEAQARCYRCWSERSAELLERSEVVQRNFTEASRRLLGSAAIYPDGTAEMTSADALTRALAFKKLAMSTFVDDDPQVDPFVAGRHDLQPRPFKRRWWSKRR